MESLKYAKLVALTLLVTWAAGGFIVLDWNVLEWSSAGRAMWIWTAAPVGFTAWLVK